MVVGGILGFSPLAEAQTTPQDQELQRAREREAAIRAQQPKAPDVRPDAQAPQVSQAPRQLPFDESPAFAIRQIGLTGEEAWRFQFALDKALTDTGLQRRRVGDQIQLFKRGTGEAGVVLGANGINELMRVMQNHVIDRGFTNSGDIAGREVVAINANNISNLRGGVISAATLALSAKTDINNIGATLKATDAMVLNSEGSK